MFSTIQRSRILAIQGGKTNKNAIGTKALAMLDNGSAVAMEIQTQAGYLSQSQAHIPLPSGVKQVSLQWPNGDHEIIPIENDLPHKIRQTDTGANDAPQSSHRKLAFPAQFEKLKNFTDELQLQLARNPNDIFLARKLLKLAPNNPYALTTLSGWHFKRGDFARAREIISQGLELYPNISFLYSTAIDMALRTKQISHANSLLSEALKKWPESETMQLLHARCLISKADFFKAKNILLSLEGNDEAYVLLSSISTEIQNIAYEALEYQKKGHLIQANRKYQKALKLNNDLHSLRNNWVWNMATSDDPQVRHPWLALNEAKKLLPQIEKNPGFIESILKAYDANQMYAEAVALCEKALRSELTPELRATITENLNKSRAKI